MVISQAFRARPAEQAGDIGAVVEAYADIVYRLAYVQADAYQDTDAYILCAIGISLDRTDLVAHTLYHEDGEPLLTLLPIGLLA